MSAVAAERTASLEPSGLSLASQRLELCAATDEASAADTGRAADEASAAGAGRAADEASAAHAGRAAAAEASAAVTERATHGASAAVVECAARGAGATVAERAARGASAVAKCTACYETCATATARPVGHVSHAVAALGGVVGVGAELIAAGAIHLGSASAGCDDFATIRAPIVVSAAVDEHFAPDRIAICDGKAECAVAAAAVGTSARDTLFSSNVAPAPLPAAAPVATCVTPEPCAAAGAIVIAGRVSDAIFSSGTYMVTTGASAAAGEYAATDAVATGGGRAGAAMPANRCFSGASLEFRVLGTATDVDAACSRDAGEAISAGDATAYGRW